MQNNWNTNSEFPMYGKIEGYDLENNHHVYIVELNKKRPFGMDVPFVLHDEKGTIHNPNEISKWRRID